MYQIKLWEIRSSDFEILEHYYFTAKETDEDLYWNDEEDIDYLISLAIDEGDEELAESLSMKRRLE